VVAQALLNAISHRVLRTIIKHVGAVVGMLQGTFNILFPRDFHPLLPILRIIKKLKNILEHPANDVPFVSRLIVQSLLPGCPLDLVEEGKKLSAKIQPLLKQAKSASTTTSATSSSSTMDTTAPTGGKEVREPLIPSEADIMTQLLELCPACGLEVPLEDITSAVCRDGHTWGVHSPLLFFLFRTYHSFSKMLDNDIHPLHALGPHVCGV